MPTPSNNQQQQLLYDLPDDHSSALQPMSSEPGKARRNPNRSVIFKERWNVIRSNGAESRTAARRRDQRQTVNRKSNFCCVCLFFIISLGMLVSGIILGIFIFQKLYGKDRCMEANTVG